ncbi:MAG: hypothetical protein LBL55_09120, partial [Propionibacteriaceae bacterium]|nr:hypothetical protein [Propionibacteriaceae bacterium]
MRQALASLSLTHGVALGQIRAAIRSEEDRLRSLRSGADARQAIAEAQRASTTEIKALAAQAESLATRIAPASMTGDDALDAAEYVPLGRLAPDAPDAVSMPLVLPLLGHGNVALDLGADGIPVARRLIWLALDRTGPGQLDVLCFDPSRTHVVAPFQPLNAARPGLITLRQDLGELLEKLERDIDRMGAVLRGVQPNLVDHRRFVGRPVERLQLVVLADYPAGWDERARRRLLTLTRAAPEAGVSILFVCASDRSADAAALSDVAEVLGETAGRRQLEGLPDLVTLLDTADPLELEVSVAELGRKIQQKGIIEIPFQNIQPADPTWAENSADGVTFAIGEDASGQTVEVTLGDDVVHALVTGATGEGKSNLLSVIIHSLCQRYSPGELELYLVDLKEGATFAGFAPVNGRQDFLPQARLVGLKADPSFSVAVLDGLLGEAVRRNEREIIPAGTQKLKDYRERTGRRMPRIVAIFDEFQEMFRSTGKSSAGARQTADRLEQLLRKGRSSGVHVILATQGVSDVPAWQNAKAGIMAQLKCRIGLKNTDSEWHATFTSENDSVRQLQAKGQAIVNQDYGRAGEDANRIVSTAVAKGFEDYRARWWGLRPDNILPPVVFDGLAKLRLADIADALPGLRAQRGDHDPTAVLGREIKVSQDPFVARFPARPGRNLAIVGGGDAVGHEDDPDNAAIGMLQAAATSLALQFPGGDAEFVCLDWLSTAMANRNGMRPWRRFMAELGFPLWEVSPDEFPDWCRLMADSLDARRVDEGHLFILLFGVDAARLGPEPKPLAAKADQTWTWLRKIYSAGPAAGVHTLGWWASSASYLAHL